MLLIFSFLVFLQLVATEKQSGLNEAPDVHKHGELRSTFRSHDTVVAEVRTVENNHAIPGPAFSSPRRLQSDPRVLFGRS